MKTNRQFGPLRKDTNSYEIKSDYGLVVVDIPPERDMEALPAGA